jgi:hypothetical protein
MKKVMFLAVLFISVLSMQAQDKIVTSDFKVFREAYKAKEILSNNQSFAARAAISHLDLVMITEVNNLSAKHGINFVPRLKEYVSTYLPDCQTCVSAYSNCIVPCGLVHGSARETCLENCNMVMFVCIAICSIPPINQIEKDRK